MLTTGQLREWGADVDEAMVRCLNNESFYLRLVGKAAEDAGFERLEAAVAAKDWEKAFDAAHALKGVMANLALKPLCRPVQEITELLRARTDADYGPLLREIASRREELRTLLAE